MNISGTWRNETGSQLTFVAIGNDLTGSYTTAVGDAEGSYDLVGKVNRHSDISYAIGFIVNWQNGQKDSSSLTSWNGTVRELDGELVIETTWLLTKELEEDDDLFTQTRTGNSLFRKIP